MDFPSGWLDYEAFGAKGDGVTDDLPAICRAHDHANATGLRVRTRPDATYHLGRQALTASIATDTDWNSSRFTIDDRDVENHRKPLFEVVSLLPRTTLAIPRLTRDQERLDLRPEHDCHVTVVKESRKVYIRRGANQNAGVPQHDCFILRRDGRIDAPIDWDYDSVDRVEVRPMDAALLTIRGGVFTTYANRMQQPVGSSYWARNIVVTRSNTEVVGVTHYVVDETEFGHPYVGFLSAKQCADVTLRDCFVSPHKIYQTSGAAGRPVSMGSYDLSASDVVNFRMIGCTMNHILDRTRWGVAASNFCKNILLEDCVLSRMDTHMGVSGSYVIRRCTLGWMGLNAIGRGLLLVEDSTLNGNSLVNLRGDYGSTWQGDIVARNCRWVPAGGNVTWPHIISTSNDGMHDFGYPCSMPHSVTLDGLTIADGNHPETYTGPYLFSDPDKSGQADQAVPMAQRPFPYQVTRQVTLRRVQVDSGLPLQISPHAEVSAAVQVQTLD